jgi:adenylate cyclase
MAQFIVSETGKDTPADLAFNAVKCALAMMRALDEFNDARAQRGLFPVKIGVGINSGDVIAGNIGSPGRMDRTVIGDTVNVASRLEGMSKLGRHTHVIISRKTLELIGDRVEVEQLSETSVKGKTSAVEMFEVIGIKGYN